MVAMTGGLAQQLSGKRIVICAGAGGVGKTTVSAVVALGLAARGRRVAVVTIDPARRLAEALGLDELGNEPQPVASERFTASGLEVRGELLAMMLDVQRTFDELIVRLAPNDQAADSILDNPVYHHLSTAVAGSQEYTAVAKLEELATRRDFDVIVLDTPPSSSAIEFLRARSGWSAFWTRGQPRPSCVPREQRSGLPASCSPRWAESPAPDCCRTSGSSFH